MNQHNVLLILTLVACCGCSKEPVAPAAPAPPAKPVVVEKKLDVNVLSDNQLRVTVRNDGDEGWIRVNVRGSLVTTRLENGETGVEKSFREAFTTKNPPPPKEVHEFSPYQTWQTDVYVKWGETKEVAIDLPGHSSWDDVSFDVSAWGIWNEVDSAGKEK